MNYLQGKKSTGKDEYTLKVEKDYGFLTATFE